MKCIKHFCQGLTNRHVDYSTRHYSRCYDTGQTTGMLVFFGTPVLIVFGLGVVTGALIW